MISRDWAYALVEAGVSLDGDERAGFILAVDIVRDACFDILRERDEHEREDAKTAGGERGGDGAELSAYVDTALSGHAGHLDSGRRKDDR